MNNVNTNIVPMFAGLPSEPQRRKAFVSSFVLQAAGLAVLLQLGLIYPAAVVHRHQYAYISLAPPPPVNHAPQKIPAKLLDSPKLRPVVLREVAKLEPPKITAPERKPDIPDVKPVAPRSVPSFPTIAAERPAPKSPSQVKAAGFSTGSSATPTVLADARKVQTGGFGDPNGISAGNNTSGRVNIAALGSFDLPSGPGYGNGTGGSRGMRAVVASSGFGNGVATGSGMGGGGRSAKVRQAGFGDSEPVRPEPRRQQAPQTDLQPVQILSKPTPSYTADARAARVEGEVLLEVVFSASGKLRVLRVVSGLGHGLDESAIRAAEQIKYKPASRGAESVDFTAVLHIVFQLA
jgi:TonB family protein